MDAGLVALAYYLAYWFRFDGEIPAKYSDLFWRTIAFAICGSLVCFVIAGMYRHWMRYSSQREYLKIAEGTVLAVLALIGYVVIVQPVLVMSSDGLRPLTVPSGVLLVFGLLTGALITATRFVAHVIFMRGITGWRTRRSGRKVLIVGAGSGGHLLEGELRKNPELGYRPIGYVDDNKKGADILGTTFDLDEVLEDVEPDEVMIAIPSASGELRGRVVLACREHGVPGAHRPDRVRAAAGRQPPHAPAARGARGGRAGPQPGADGDRVGRRLPAPAGACWSPARAGRSAPRSAARSRG